MDNSRYRIAQIPKRSGGLRVLEIPDPELMARQRAILGWLYARRLAASPCAHGFVRRRSIVTNAEPHVGKAVVVRIDLEDFFPSVKATMVREALVSNGVAKQDSEAIVEACTLDGRLPQGAPTSPFLANLAASRLDHRLSGLAREWRDGALGTTYTRYADDLTISSDDPKLNHIVPVVQRIVEDCGFKVNRAKTRICRRGSRQIIAGVVVNDRPNVPRTLRRNLRAALHQAREGILRGDPGPVDVERLRGLAAHVHAVNPSAGGRFIRDVDEIARLVAVRERVLGGQIR
jgi:retron-type reverse transcriptase